MASVLRASCREEGGVRTAPRRRTGRPTLRLVHHMARSGGTPISRCLGCMSGVLLLSEIHPLGTARFNPLVQAQRWYGLLSSRDLAELRARQGIGFVDAIELIHQRAVDAGQRLVIRDWSHLDFTGVPFVANPAFRLLTAEALAGRFELRQICTVRHPLDQWLSLRGLAVVQGKLTLERYLALRGLRGRSGSRHERALPPSRAPVRSSLRRAVVELRVRHRRRLGEPRRYRHPAGAAPAGGARAARAPADEPGLRREPRAARLRAPESRRLRGRGRRRCRARHLTTARPR
jgi:hypothetical protein